MYQQDWLMNQIDSMIQVIAKILLNKVAISNKSLIKIDDTKITSLHLELQEKINQLNINEAENTLFDYIETTNELSYLIVAVNFYKSLNELSDQELERSNYSRDEIKEGLMEISQLFGIVL